MLDPSLIPLVQRLDRDPEDQEAVQQLWRALSDRGDFQTLAVLAEKVAGRRRTPSTAAELLFRAAELWSRELGRDERAVPLWQRVMELDPKNDAAVSSLAGAYVRAGRVDLATPLHRRVLEHAQDPRRKLPILEQMSVMRAEAGDVEGQMAVLREIIALDLPIAATVEHRRALARLLVQRGRAVQGDGDGEAPADIREAARMLGSIAREGGTARASDFAAAALALWPGEENAFQILQSTLSLRHAELTTLRIKFLAANPGSRMASQVRADLADGYLAAGRVDDAIAVLAASVSEDPSAAQRLARLYERTGRHKDLAALLNATPLPSDRAQRLVLFRRRASVQRAVGDRKAQLAALRDVLGEAPADPEAFAEVERDCRLRGDLVELRARVRAAAGVEGIEVAARVRWYREAAQLAERAGDFDDALAQLERAAGVADDAEVDDLYDSIARILSHLDRWDELLERVSARAVAAHDAAGRRRWWLRWVDAQRLHRPDPAREAEVLSALVHDDPQDDSVALALADAHRRAGNPAGVEAVLTALVARSTPENAGKRWSQLAGHREQVGNIAGALDAWRQARAVDATQAMAWAAEERILEHTGQRRELLDVLTAHAGHPTATGRRAGELFTRAALLAKELGIEAEAARLARRALTFVPDDAALRELAEKAAPEAPAETARERAERSPNGAFEGADDVPLSLLGDDLGDAGEAMEHDTGEFPVAIAEADGRGVFAEEASGVFSAEASLHDTGEHTPAEGHRFAAEEVPRLHDDDAREETRELRAIAPEVGEAHTREIVVPASVDVHARPRDEVASVEEAPTRERAALRPVEEVATGELVAIVPRDDVAAPVLRSLADNEYEEPPTRELRALSVPTPVASLEARETHPEHAEHAEHEDLSDEDLIVEDLVDDLTGRASEAKTAERPAHREGPREDHVEARDVDEERGEPPTRVSIPPAPPKKKIEDLIEEPTRPLQDALREARSEIARQSVAPPTPVRPIPPAASAPLTTPAKPLPAARPLQPVKPPAPSVAKPDDAPARAALKSEPPPRPAEHEELPDDSILVEVDLSAFEEPSKPEKPSEEALEARVSAPPPAPPPPVVAAPKAPEPPAVELPSIIVDDSLLGSSAPSTSPAPAPSATPARPAANASESTTARPPTSTPTLAGMPPPKPSSPRVAIPPLTQTSPAPTQLPPLSAPLPPRSAPLPPLSAPLPPLSAPLPPLSAPLPPLAQPVPPLAAPGAPVLPPHAPSQVPARPASANTPAAPLPYTQTFAPPQQPSPALPPLSSAGFFAASPPAQPVAPPTSNPYPQPPPSPPMPSYAQPLPALAQTAPVGAPLAPLAPPPGSPLGGDPFTATSSQHAFPPLGVPAFNAAHAPPPPLTYVADTSSGDPFASSAAPARAFVGAAPQHTYAPDASGDPFASSAPVQMPAPMQMPPLAPPPQAAVSNYQKPMAAMFEQAIASIRAHG